MGDATGQLAWLQASSLLLNLPYGNTQPQAPAQGGLLAVS